MPSCNVFLASWPVSFNERMALNKGTFKFELGVLGVLESIGKTLSIDSLWIVGFYAG